jgi:murein L,D-transpeptidase YcbB/YkuD
MLRNPLLIFALLLGTILTPFEIASAENLSERVSEILENRVRDSANLKKTSCGAKLICGSAVLADFYRSRTYRPAWSTDNGLRWESMVLIRAIIEAELEGLRSEDYHLSSIEMLLIEIGNDQATNKIPDPDKFADFDLLLTDAFLVYGAHLAKGRVNPQKIQSEWFIKTRKVNLLKVLRYALASGQIEESLNILRPQSDVYEAMKHHLKKYKDILNLGGWQRIPRGSLLQKGSRGKRVALLHARLTFSGDLDESGITDHLFFDENLDQAVRRFQKRHGLLIDGMVGHETLAALNVPVEGRIKIITFNMERLRWLPRDLGERYVFINIANFELNIVEGEQILSTMRVVVGRKARPTPIFTGRMTYMELNPYWYIPGKIAREDILPRILDDPNYLSKENIRVFRTWKEPALEIDPGTVDWALITRNNFPFKLRQEPGSSNALGRIKFVFPNKFSVFLHDTPAQALFNKTKRSSSSGCIRVENPIELAEYLLKGQAKWNREKIMTTINKGRRKILVIPDPIKVHVLYLTAWVEKDGTLNFRDDIYGKDEPLKKALEERPLTQKRIPSVSGMPDI